MTGQRDQELEVIPLSNDDEDSERRRHRSRPAVAVLCSLLVGVIVVLALALVRSRQTVNRLRLDIRAAVADPCHWVEVPDVEDATHAPMMGTTRTNGTAAQYQQGCIYTLFEGPVRTVIVLVDTPRNPLYRKALNSPGGILTLDRMTAVASGGVVVIVETPGSLGPSGPVTRALAAKVVQRLPKPPGTHCQLTSRDRHRPTCELALLRSIGEAPVFPALDHVRRSAEPDRSVSFAQHRVFTVQLGRFISRHVGLVSQAT